MNDILFFNNFRFFEFSYDESKHRDNSIGVDFHYLGMIKKGRGVIISENKRLEIGENEMFYIPKGCKYHSHWISEGGIIFDSIGFFYFPSKEKNGYSLQKIAYDAEIFEAYLPLSRDKTLSAASIGRLYTLLGILEDTLEAAPMNKEEAVIEKLLLLMEHDPHCTVSEYAEQCGVSETTLYGLIKKGLQKTPNRLRREILCKKATDLLRVTNLTVEEICDRLRFSSASYFRKVLRSVCGQTPSQIRKNANTI